MDDDITREGTATPGTAAPGTATPRTDTPGTDAARDAAADTTTDTTTAAVAQEPARAETYRSVEIERLETGVYLARNDRGGELRFGSDADVDFTPVELLLVALAGCSAVDVDHMTSRRALPTEFRVRAEGHKVREEGGTIMRDLALTFHVRFPDGADGDQARDVLPKAVQVSHDRACTVSRTVEAGVPVAVRID